MDGKTTERLIVEFPKDKRGLFIQPEPEKTEKEKAKYEMEERLRRMMFAEVFDYADQITGNTATFHEEGNYNCGDCNKQYEKHSCTLISISVDKEAGSCRKFEIRRACDEELVVHGTFTSEEAMYGVAANGEGFGCHRCPWHDVAYEPDSVGRAMYCGKGRFRVPWNACCAINGAKTI